MRKKERVHAKPPKWGESRNISSMHLVDPEDAPKGYPKLDPRIVPGTKFRVTPDDELDSLVTVMPDGVHVAWTTCTKCLQWFTSCDCRAGVLHTQGIEWIYVRSMIAKEGTYSSGDRINVDSLDVRKHGLYFYAPKAERGLAVSHMGFMPGTKSRTSPPARPRGKLRKKDQTRPVNGPQTVRKPLRKVGMPQRTVSPSEVAPEPFDLGALNRDASSRTTDLESAFEQAVSSDGKKPLRKRKSTASTSNGNGKPIKKRLRKKD